MARCLGLQSPHAIRVLVHLAHVCSLPHLGLCLLCTEEEEPWDLNSSWALTGEKYSCHTPSSSLPPPLPLSPSSSPPPHIPAGHPVPQFLGSLPTSSHPLLSLRLLAGELLLWSLHNHWVRGGWQCSQCLLVTQPSQMTE